MARDLEPQHAQRLVDVGDESSRHAINLSMQAVKIATIAAAMSYRRSAPANPMIVTNVARRTATTPDVIPAGTIRARFASMRSS